MTQRRHEPRPLAEVVFDRRHELNLTQVELAAQAGVSHRTVQHIEAGTTRPVPAVLTAVARALGIPAGDLLRIAERPAAEVTS